MLEVSLKFLSEIEKHGFKAYIVGGFVRDHLLGIKSNDVDVCTNAKPSEIKHIFKNFCIPVSEYGSVVVEYNGIRFEVTTFRKEISYIDNRKPLEYVYIDSLEEDLKRRDFTINTMCIDSSGNVIDLLNGKIDLSKQEINTVGDSNKKFSEDALRMLRAVRFATVLNFKLSSDVKNAIINNKSLIKNLSYERKKEELDKIFGSIHVKYGVKLLIELGLDEALEIPSLRTINSFDNLIGIWALLDVTDIYPFTKNEKDLIFSILEALECDNLDTFTLYKYGSYINSICADIKGLSKKEVAAKYRSLPIKERKEIQITGDQIMKILNKKPGEYIKQIYDDLEHSILLGNLDNTYESIEKYIIDKYLSTHI